MLQAQLSSPVLGPPSSACYRRAREEHLAQFQKQVLWLNSFFGVTTSVAPPVLQAALEQQLMRSDVERMMKEEMVGAGCWCLNGCCIGDHACVGVHDCTAAKQPPAAAPTGQMLVAGRAGA